MGVDAPLPGCERRSHWAPEEFRELVFLGRWQRTETEVVLGLPPKQPSDDGATNCYSGSASRTTRGSESAKRLAA